MNPLTAAQAPHPGRLRWCAYGAVEHRSGVAAGDGKFLKRSAVSHAHAKPWAWHAAQVLSKHSKTPKIRNIQNSGIGTRDRLNCLCLVRRTDMTTTSDIRRLPTEAKCLRVRRYYLVVGVVGAVSIAVMGVTSTVVAYLNIDGSFARPQLAAVVFGVFWSGFTLLALWLIAAYFRERLILAKNTIVQDGIFRSRTLDVGDVLQIRWRRWPAGGSIIVRSHSQKFKIYLDNFTKAEREEVVFFIRETFAHEIQENWSRFEECARRLSAPERRFSRGGIIVIASVFMSIAGVFMYCWFAGLGVQYLFIGVVNAVAAIWYLWRFRVAKDRSVIEVSKSQERTES